MFNLFKKRQGSLVKHRYRNLFIYLPDHWVYDVEQGAQEACYDPNSQSTLRIKIITAKHPEETTNEEDIKSLTGNRPYTTTKKGYLLTKPDCIESVESNKEITLVTWRLIDNSRPEKVIIIVTYTMLSEEKDSTQEKGIITLIGNSLENAEFD